ncbi:DNA replication licensing factor mcm3 [Smittium culicis]|uniref:DNA replication licensing factor MCM3 n=1 Tax=Smittium culicis TaxID=133412 RepID=A0A1R1YFU3_9FUNG|nr:DNA replication licensing factor mcm3 [Smittium culicis]
MAMATARPYGDANIMGNLGTLADDLRKERTNFFKDFLNQDYAENEYRNELKRLAESGGGRLIVDLDNIREFDNDASAATEIAREFYNPGTLQDSDVASAPGADGFYISIGFVGSFGSQHVSPRKLGADLLGKLVCIEGIVTRISLVRPKVVRSVHYSEKKQTFYAKNYKDQTSANHAFSDILNNTSNTSSSGYPKEDEEGNPLTTEFGLSYYANYQTINVQEMPERAPPGQLPRGVDIILEGDLVDTTKPGDRVLIVGIYRALAGKLVASTSGIFRSLVIASSIRGFGASSLVWSGNSANQTGSSAQKNSSSSLSDIASIQLTDGDIENIRTVSNRPDVVNLLSKSLAPSICGNSEIKQALLLLLLGGSELNLESGSHIRGDINMLMVGDPSTAKSQVLRYVLRIAPLAIATTGRGSSGVGLTAAVTTDKDTGERRLEAGAMVLADRGIVCIDEFDKMTDTDRVAIHEAMEQQTVTVSKAGIHTTLNARCSVVAAANPIYGRYDPSRPPHQNIALPDSLLSRFDLLFIVTDVADEQRDRELSQHVLNMHRYVPPGLDQGQPIDDVLDSSLIDIVGSNQSSENTRDSELGADKAKSDCQIFEPSSEFIDLSVRSTRNTSGISSEKSKCLTTQFLRRYIYYAKTLIKPTLKKESAEYLSNAYADLRMQAATLSSGRKTGTPTTAPITPRTFETLIRLSTAHAKARLSPTIDEIDAKSAKDILSYALFRENFDKAPSVDKSEKQTNKSINRRAAKKVKTGTLLDSDSDQSNDDENSANKQAKPRKPSSSKSNKNGKLSASSRRAEKLRRAANKKYKDLIDGDDDDDDREFKLNNEDDDFSMSSRSPSPELLPVSRAQRSSRNKNQKVSADETDSELDAISEIDEDNEMESEVVQTQERITPERFELFKKAFQLAISQRLLVQTDDGSAWSISQDVLTSVNKIVSDQKLDSTEFTGDEVLYALDMLQSENRVFLSGDSVYMI